MTYAINWDNGGEACGTFPQRFDNEPDAEAWAENWARERNLEDLGMSDADVEECGGEGCYTAEVIEVEDEPDEEEGMQDEGTLSYFNQYIAGDR